LMTKSKDIFDRKEPRERHGRSGHEAVGGRQYLVGLPHPVRRGFVYVRPEAIVLFAKRRELAQPTWFESQKATHPGGAPERYEWALIENLLEKECELQGSVPHSGHNDPEWRSKTHAIKYVREKMSRDWRDDGPADSTLRDRVSQMLDRITERLKKAEN
jgi:hypothetical protein